MKIEITVVQTLTFKEVVEATPEEIKRFENGEFNWPTIDKNSDSENESDWRESNSEESVRNLDWYLS